MQIKLTWSEFKEYAYKSIAKDYPNIINDDSSQFMRTNGYEPDGTVYDLPEYILINLEEK